MSSMNSGASSGLPSGVRAADSEACLDGSEPALLVDLPAPA